MKILVTGGAGFIGSHVVEALQNDHEVVIIDDLNDYYSPEYKRANLALLKPVALYETDVTDQAALTQIFTEHQFDCIVHLAARAGVRPSIAEPELYAHVNMLGTTLLAQLAVEHNVKQFVFGSTSAVYGNSTPVPFAENAEVNHPISPYAATKRAAELMLATYHELYSLPITILRFFTVYGERGRPDMAPYLFTEALLRGESIKKFGTGESSRDYTYVKDIVAGIVAAIDKSFAYEIINLGNHQPVSLNEFIQTLEEVTGTSAKIERCDMQPGDVERTYADITKARDLLGFEPTTSLRDGLEKFVDWFRKNRLS